MKHYYQTKGCLKYSEEDVFASGCIPEISSTIFTRETLKEDTLEKLIKTCAQNVGCEDESNILKDSCDEKGRLDIQVLEDAEGEPATESQIAAWKVGKCRLWAATYTFYITSIIEDKVSLITEEIIL